MINHVESVVLTSGVVAVFSLGPQHARWRTQHALRWQTMARQRRQATSEMMWLQYSHIVFSESCDEPAR